MHDPKSEDIELSIHGRDFSIKQSPGVLQSQREGGTTGAALWRASILFAEWLQWNKNPLFQCGVIDSQTIALELGSGISGLLPLILSPRVQRVIATDQQYALKLLQQNIDNNIPAIRTKSNKAHIQNSNIDVLALDWETDDIASFLAANGVPYGVDAVFVCDCVFNYALIKPLVDACVDFCKVRARCAGQTPPKQTVCVVAQQLRQPEVFEQWLTAFMASYRVWRVPDEMLIEALKEGSGYVVHIGILRETNK
jgi:hypothetical protein